MNQLIIRRGCVLASLLFATTIWGGPAVGRKDPTASPDALAEGFRSPPATARPHVWWHWMDGNVSKDGIAKDLEWLQRIGIGGVQQFDAGLNTPQIVPERLNYMTPPWKDAFRFAVDTARRLGLEMTIAASPGWSETGGPWVPPGDGMKKLVWSQMDLAGGKPFAGLLPSPPDQTGPFQSLVEAEEKGIFSDPRKAKPPIHYADVAVLAYPLALQSAMPPARISSAGKGLDAAALTDDSYETVVEVGEGTVDQPGTVLMEYAAAQTISSVAFFSPGAANMFGLASLAPRLEASDDGRNWRRVADMQLGVAPTTVSFAPVTARQFRIVLNERAVRSPFSFSPAPGADTGSSGSAGTPKRTISIADLRLSRQARVNQFEAKAGFSVARDYYGLDGDTGLDIAGIAPGEVIDLTARMAADGQLRWAPPPGRWRVLRLGYSLTGKTNHPASPEATGLEVDKMDAAAVRRYLGHYMDLYREVLGTDRLAGKGLGALVTDSTEVGSFNWTPGLVGQFKRLRGYDPTPFLPALTGTIIGSRRTSDAFLFDFRRTLADLHASEHYGTIARVARENGLSVYGEALEAGRLSLGDDIDMRAYADVPMAALWTYPRGQFPSPGAQADMKGASSVAHLYGRSLAAAESMTSGLNPWAHAPSDLRRVIDFVFAQGINRPIIHTSVHQPVDDKVPGLSLLIFGQFFNRHESWAEMARPWIDYIARNSFMLKQGRNVADVAYFIGEEAPLVAQAENGFLPDVPKRYAYDFVSAKALVDLFTVEGGSLATPAGALYRVLYLGGTSSRMTLPVLRRIAKLAGAGATIVGDAPLGSPGLGDDPAEYAAIVRRLWPGGAITKVGKGSVIAGREVERALASIGVEPDFSYDGADRTELLFVHRRLDDGDIYYVNNRKDLPATVHARFRVKNRTPEIWRADTGAFEAANYRLDGDSVIVPLDLAPEESFYVVFRETARAPARTTTKPRPVPVATLDGDWEVAFQPGRGAPPRATFAKLASLSESGQPGIRYFSGTATYSKRFHLPRTVASRRPLWIDLGAIGDLAEIRVNGVLVGSTWHTPYRLDISGAARSGANTVEVKVANLWVNRLIGDAQPGAQRTTFTTIPTYRADAPLRPSGLIGPVRLFALNASDP